MDTQINISIKQIFFNSSNYKTKEISFNLSDFYKLYSKNNLFEFREYDKIEISFYCNDKDVILNIECPFKQNDNNNLLILYSGQTELLSLGGDLENMFVPGEYSIQLLKNNICYEGLYNILPNSMDYNSITNIRKYLEDKVKDLAYNIYLEKKASKNTNLYLEKSTNIFRYLHSSKEKLFSCIEYIIDNPILDTKKEYVIRNYQKTQDFKTQRWLSKYGHKYNQNINNPNTTCDKICCLTFENTENIILKIIINFIQNTLTESELEYIRIIRNIDKNIYDLENKIIEKSNLIKEASRFHNTQNINKIKLSEIEVLKQEIYKHNENKSKIKNNLEELYKIKGKLNFYTNETWLNNIKLKYNLPVVTMKILKNHHYNEVYLIYESLRKESVVGGFDITFPYKKTSKLFEIYSFLITKDIFEELGFTWTEGWLKSQSHSEIFSGDLVSEDFLLMENENYKLIMYYDKYIKTPDELKNTKLSQPSAKPKDQHRRPDILISLYKDDKLLGCEVIEVKYRKKSNIYNTKGIDTDVCTQLSSYTKFDYYDADKGRVTRENPVYKVLTLYPKQDNSGQYKHEHYEIEFIPIMPDKDDFNKYYGYENLKIELKEFLNYYSQLTLKSW